MKDFKHTGRGPKYGNFSFSSKAGFSGSTGKTQQVKSYTRTVPKRKFADGGVVREASPGSSVVRRDRPVTEFDAQHGGKSPLRTGYAEGGKIKKARGGLLTGIQDISPKVNRVNAGPVKAPPTQPRGAFVGRTNAGPVKAPPVAAPIVGRAPPARVPTPPIGHHRYGTFRRGPMFGKQ